MTAIQKLIKSLETKLERQETIAAQTKDQISELKAMPAKR